MTRDQRLDAVLGLLAQEGRLTVGDAAARLGASTATIRRDLDHLAEHQLLRRTRGGAVAHGHDLPLSYKVARAAPQKQAIGRAAAALVEPGQVVGLGGGTTVTEVARALAARAEPLTLVTNALNIAYELTVHPHLRIVVVGGVVRGQSYEVMGPLARTMLDEVAIDVTVIGVDALDATLGASAHHDGEAEVNRLMVARSRRVVVVADAGKLGRRALARVCPPDAIDVLVTDAEPEPALAVAFATAGVGVVVARA